MERAEGRAHNPDIEQKKEGVKKEQVKGPGSPTGVPCRVTSPGRAGRCGLFALFHHPNNPGSVGRHWGYDRGQKHEISRWQAIFAGVTAGVNERMKKNMADKDLKQKFALWIRPSLLEEVDSLYESDNCASRSEFMEKALQFYIGHLTCNHAQDYLAQVIPSTVKGIVDESSNRISRLLFKMAVEQAVSENILAAVCDVDQTELKRLRGQCIEEIRKTNGMISFDKALSWQRDD